MILQNLNIRNETVIIISLAFILLSGFLLTRITKKLKLPNVIAYILAGVLIDSIGAATALASTIMTIRQYKAKGDFVNLILQVVALDDVVALIAFSISATIVQAMELNVSLNIMLFLAPLLLNFATILLGLLFGFILQKIITNKRTTDNKLILAVALILLMAGICATLDISPLLSSMAMGAAYVNISEDNSLFKKLNYFTPPILMIFFVLSGMRLDLSSLKTGGIIGISYFFIRIIGKYLGSYIGTSLGNYPSHIKNYFGLALISQAGVSIGLALLGQRMLLTEMGDLLSTIILSSSILYEIVGPAAAKASLHLSGSIPVESIEGKA